MTIAVACILLAALILGAYVLACLAWRQWSAGRVMIVVGFIAIIAGLGFAAERLLGLPKPVEIELRATGEATLVSWTMQEGVAIWVWVTYPGDPEPMSYRLPWESSQAQQLYEATSRAEQMGTGTMIDLAGPPGEPMAWPEPQPPTPPKQ